MGPDGQPQKQAEMRGCVVSKVVAGSPAEKAGLRSGDAILSVDQTRIDARHDLASLIAARKPGDSLTLSVQSRGRAPRDVKVTLGKDAGKDAAFLGVEIMPNPPAPRGGEGREAGPRGSVGST
jgi:S1-C subfamily serine protease